MPGFAGAFGHAVVRESMQRQLIPGAVVYLKVDFPEAPRNKFLILAVSCEDDYFFVVNSAVNNFIASNPELSSCQVTLELATHSFLKHDSVVACHQVHRFAREDIIAALIQDPSQLVGNVSTEVACQMLAAVKLARTIDRRTQALIIAALEPIAY